MSTQRWLKDGPQLGGQLPFRSALPDTSKRWSEIDLLDGYSPSTFVGNPPLLDASEFVV